ncbi:MAG: hypothetical protein H6553_06780 [Chitinophagales bacterium]|nr:hypothetical protein [Chitinophagales bacterium]
MENEDKIIMNVPEVLRSFLLKKGIKQSDVAEEMRYKNSQNLSIKLNSNKKRISTEVIEKMSIATNINMFKVLAIEFENLTGIREPKTKNANSSQLEKALMDFIIERFPNVINR